MTDEYGLWKPVSVEKLGGLFAGAPIRWWITGGLALELYAGHPWRAHEDTDIGICRAQALLVRDWLSNLTLYVAAGGRVRLWNGELLSAERSENNVWVKQQPDGPWLFDIAVGEGDDSGWVYRRDARIRRPWSEVILKTSSGVPYLAPEIQLLFKSKGRRERDELDAKVVAPLMEPNQRRWLIERLPADHPWHSLLETASHRHP